MCLISTSSIYGICYRCEYSSKVLVKMFHQTARQHSFCQKTIPLPAQIFSKLFPIYRLKRLKYQILPRYLDTMSCSFSSTFFTGTCGSGNNPDHFKDLAEKTSGQVIRLTTNGELKQLSGLTGSVLGGSNTVSVGSNESRRKKRSASHSKHSIILDDSIEDVTFSINTENAIRADVTLKDPNNVVITSGKISLSKVHVYQIKNPTTGTWVLTIPSAAGKSDFFVKGSSATNIDFEHSFLIHRTRGRMVEEVPIHHPIIGGYFTFSLE